MNNNLKTGDVITLTAPSGGVTSGLGYKIGQLFVVATNTIDETLPFEGLVSGVVELVKDAGTAWTEGEHIYWDDSAKNCVDASGTVAGKMLIGCAADAAGSAAVLGKVRLNAAARADGVSDMELEDDAVDTAAIQDVAVTTAKIALLAVDTGQLAADAVDGTKIEDNAVDTEHIAALAVETAELADDAVTAAKAVIFVSTEQTATGSSQNVAHGLGGTPTAVLIVPTSHPGTPDTGAFDIAEGAHDETNVVVTVTVNVTFKVFAWL